MIKGPTRLTKVSKTLIDLVFTNRIEGVTKTYNLITGLSDHNMVLIVRKQTKKLLKSWCNGKPEFVGIPKNKTTQFENDLRNISWDGAIQSQNVNTCCDTMMKTFTNPMQKYTQKLRKTRRPRVLPWLNKDIHQLMKERDLALKQSLVTRNNSDTYFQRFKK